MKYLGLETTYNGNTEEAIKSCMAKADRAINMCKQAFSAVGNVNIGLAMSVFEKQLSPILTYLAPIWGLKKANRCLLVEASPAILKIYLNIFEK